MRPVRAADGDAMELWRAERAARAFRWSAGAAFRTRPTSIRSEVGVPEAASGWTARPPPRAQGARSPGSRAARDAEQPLPHRQLTPGSAGTCRSVKRSTAPAAARSASAIARRRSRSNERPRAGGGRGPSVSDDQPRASGQQTSTAEPVDDPHVDERPRDAVAGGTSSRNASSERRCAWIVPRSSVVDGVCVAASCPEVRRPAIADVQPQRARPRSTGRSRARRAWTRERQVARASGPGVVDAGRRRRPSSAA